MLNGTVHPSRPQDRHKSPIQAYNACFSQTVLQKRGAGRSPVEGKMKSVVGVLGRVSTQTLLQIIVVLAATVAMKAYLVFM